MYDDNEMITVLDLRSLYEHALLKKGYITVGEVKQCIREYKLHGICHIGEKGIREIIEKMSDQVGDDDRLREAISSYKKMYPFQCNILRKPCPTDADCSGCRLFQVYQAFEKMN